MRILEHLKYTKSHEWVASMPGGNLRVGITDFAQAKMGDIVFINLPSLGDRVSVGGSLTDIESVKAVADVYSPLTGEVVAVNTALEDAPETLNAAPYEAWICEIAGVTDTEELMDAAAYGAFCEAEGE